MKEVAGKEVAGWALEVWVCALLSSWTLDEEAAQLEENHIADQDTRVEPIQAFVKSRPYLSSVRAPRRAKSINFRWRLSLGLTEIRALVSRAQLNPSQVPKTTIQRREEDNNAEAKSQQHSIAERWPKGWA